MYALSDKPSAIREVQRFLHVISDRVDDTVPRIAIDGIYGKETEEAVRAFQLLYGLVPSGTVDLATFDMLYSVYSEEILDINLRSYIITDTGFPIVVGMQNDDVLVTHLMFSELEKTYNDIGKAPHSTYYSEDSRSIAMELQKIFRLPVTGEIDASFFDRMIVEIDAIKRLNEVYE